MDCRPYFVDTVKLGAESIEAVNQIIEHLADHGIHGATGALKAGEVGMGGWEVLQHARWPGIDDSDTSVSRRGGGRPDLWKKYRELRCILGKVRWL